MLEVEAISKNVAASKKKVNAEVRKEEGINGTMPPVIDGLQFQKVPGDGHCLFHAVGLYVNESQNFLRRIVVAHLEHNLEDYRGFFALKKGQTVENYIQAVKAGKEWADNIEIEILMRVLNKPIIVIGPHGDIRNKDALDRGFTGEPIFVYYNGRDHYDVFLLKERADPFHILKCLRFNNNNSKDELLASCTLVEDSNFEPQKTASYTAKDMDVCIRGSFNRYKLQYVDGCQFLVQTLAKCNPNETTAILHAIEVGTIYSSISDYFAGIRRQQVTLGSSPNTSSLLRSSQELWKELSGYIIKPESKIRILFPFTINPQSWVIGEIVIFKENNQYYLYFCVLDPLGCSILQASDYKQIKSLVMDRIRKIDPVANFADTQCQVTPSQRLLNYDDTASSCVVAVEQLLTRVVGGNYEHIQECGALNLRRKQLQSVNDSFEPNDPKRTQFIERYAIQTCDILMQALGEFQQNIVYTNEYKPQLTEEQVAYFTTTQTSDVMKLNEQAAFYAAKTGNLLLMTALLGVEFSEEEAAEKEYVNKMQYASYEPSLVKQYEVGVLDKQIELIKETLQRPEQLQDLAELKKQLKQEAFNCVENAIVALRVWLAARDRVFYNSQYITFSNLSPEKQDKLLNNFRNKLIQSNANHYNSFNDWKFELATKLGLLETEKKDAEKAFESNHEVSEKNNMRDQVLLTKYNDASLRHRITIAKLWKLKKETLPDYFPKDEFGLWKQLCAAKVPVNLRNEKNNTLLHEAYLHRHMGVVFLLLSRGADIDAVNNDLLTAADLAHEKRLTLVVLQQRAKQILETQSKCLREIIKIKDAYYAELQRDIEWARTSVVGGLVSNMVRLNNRRNVVISLERLIELATLEVDDTKLVTYLRNELTKHFSNKFLFWFKDRGLLNRSRLFESLLIVLRKINQNKHDYEFVRLANNLTSYFMQEETFELERWLQQEKQTTNVLREQLKTAISDRNKIEERTDAELRELREQLDMEKKGRAADKKEVDIRFEALEKRIADLMRPFSAERASGANGAQTSKEAKSHPCQADENTSSSSIVTGLVNNGLCAQKRRENGSVERQQYSGGLSPNNGSH